MELERSVCLVAGLVWASAAFAYLGETGMGGGTGGIGGDGGLELLFGPGNKALGEGVVAELRVLCGLLGGRKRGHAGGAHLVKLKGRLAEGCFGVGAADTFEGCEV